jgi:hypothetical protein
MNLQLQAWAYDHSPDPCRGGGGDGGNVGGSLRVVAPLLQAQHFPVTRISFTKLTPGLFQYPRLAVEVTLMTIV